MSGVEALLSRANATTADNSSTGQAHWQPSIVKTQHNQEPGVDALHGIALAPVLACWPTAAIHKPGDEAAMQSSPSPHDHRCSCAPTF